MPENVCPICDKRVSNWEMAAGKCLWVNRKLVHAACTVELTAQQVMEKCQ